MTDRNGNVLRMIDNRDSGPTRKGRCVNRLTAISRNGIRLSVISSCVNVPSVTGKSGQGSNMTGRNGSGLSVLTRKDRRGDLLSVISDRGVATMSSTGSKMAERNANQASVAESAGKA